MTPRVIPTLPLNQQTVAEQHWPLQMGEPLREAKYSQQQCKCNKRQLGTETPPAPNAQMH